MSCYKEENSDCLNSIKNSERSNRRISQMKKRKAFLNTTDSSKIDNSVKEVTTHKHNTSEHIKSALMIYDTQESDEDKEINISNLNCDI